ncbi:MAG: HD domain-containing protein [Patescibacteria group bacterium]|jgi:hypothetical protein
MKISDPIYGEFEITEPVILDLLESPAMLRIKNVSQYGIPDEYYELINFSRFEHSLGVMLLLRKLKAPIEEQIAGLLHDVSHFAFSHIADWVFAGGGTLGNVEDFHDRGHEVFIEKTELPALLKRHGFDVDKITDENNFPLLNNEIPDVCADRFDYAIQEIYRFLEPSSTLECVASLRNHNNSIVFADQKSALKFAKLFLRLQQEHWGHSNTTARYRYFSNALKRALGLGIIAKEDFYLTDDHMMSKILKANDPEIDRTLDLLRDKKFYQNLKKTGQVIHKKFRYVDPLFLSGDSTLRLSEVDSEFKKIIEDARKENSKGIEI